MRAGRAAGWMLVTILVAACGGSGSSGFDVTPGGLEAPLIQRAIAEQRCVAADGDLLICPSGVPVLDPDGGMHSPHPSELRVEASLVHQVDCGPSGDCMLSVDVTIAGLPEGAAVRLAVRSTTDDVWRVGEPLALPASGSDDGVVTPVGSELPGEAAPGDEVQVAVLVFVPPIGAVPTEVAELRETGARYAFVLAPVTLTPGASS